MPENLPPYISITFILTTFLTVGFFLHAIKTTVIDKFPAKLLIFLLSFWIVFPALLALNGFYLVTENVFPPRVFAFGVLPALLIIIIYLIFFRKNFVEKLPLKTLTFLHIIRIPVEIVLFWLFQNTLIPQEMTFEGRNFDILSGITAPIVYFFAFRHNRTNRKLLIIWNIFALLLLFNIVITAILALPSPIQQIALAQPNRAVLFFPYVWLPALIVPIVFFSHLATFVQIFKKTPN